MQLVAGSSHLKLGGSLAKALGASLAQVNLSQFSNGEKRVQIQTPLAGEIVVILQSLTTPVDDRLVETLLLADAAERSGAKALYLVMPWLGYSLQDKVFQSGEPIASKVIAAMLSTGRFQRIFLLDLHNASEAGFFSLPTEHLNFLPEFATYCQTTFDLDHSVVVSPDFGGLKRARELAVKLKTPLANCDKNRNMQSGIVTVMDLHGDVTGLDAIVFDDVIVTGGTASEIAKTLKDHGARSVHWLVTHGLFAGDARQQLADSQIDSIVISNSIEQTQLPAKTTVLDLTSILTRTLKPWLR
ncbi:MAG TPA: ribose-phosphate pyrophosphokinase [Candidatus Pacebacteria bacterium]|nr:ribose-phosphate pyrophosphokinase [Candidatus Paceibacterota bacterium]